jgi:hypothetical protein
MIAAINGWEIYWLVVRTSRLHLWGGCVEGIIYFVPHQVERKHKVL